MDSDDEEAPDLMEVPSDYHKVVPICCTLKDDLITTLEQLIIHKDRFDYIIIETTGLANPGPVISTFWTDDGLHSSLKLDGVVCVVDSLNILNYLTSSDISGDVQLQICYADRVLLNKADLVNSPLDHTCGDNLVIVIGKHLDVGAIETGLRGCLVV
eukprot:gene26404-32982_t